MKIMKKTLMLVMMAVLLNASLTTISAKNAVLLNAGLTTISAKTAVMTIGTVVFFNESKGYGFIQPDGGGAYAYVHISAVHAAGMQTLDRDQRVSYDLETDRRGKTSAVNIQAA